MQTPFAYRQELTISVRVSDLDRAIEWYRDTLGFELAYKLDDMGWCELKTAHDGVTVGLGQAEELNQGGTVPVFGVENIDEARSYIEGKGTRFDGETQVIPDMVKLATFFDPDGNPWMLAETLPGMMPR
jgi:predicted enzyme related to lactoylglutathione lyase